MNKLTKGAIAGAAGITLLLGGGTTFALWNSSAEVAGGTIESGNLVVAVATELVDGVKRDIAGVWTDQTKAPINLATFRAAPGDVLTYTKVMHITATGDNLVALLKLDAGSIVKGDSSVPADVELAEYLTSTAVLEATGPGITKNLPPELYRTVAGLPGEYTITAGSAGVSRDVTVAVTITFPKNAAAGFENNTMLGSVSLQDMVISLTQI